MFYTGTEKVRLEAKFFEIQDQIFGLRNRIEILESTNQALLKIATNKAKLDAEKSSVTVTVHAPHGLKKDGTPKKKPGPKGVKQ